MSGQTQSAFDGQSVFVSDSTSLLEAYQSLSTTGGGTIYVSAGTEPIELVLNNGGSDPVRIVSSDPLNPVELTRLKISDAENVTVQSFRVDSSGVEDRDYSMDMEILGSSQIKINDVDFTGQATSYFEDGSDTGQEVGIIRNSSDIEFSANTVSNYFQGLMLRDSSNILIKDNDISQMQADGLRMEGVQGVRIEGNKFHEFLGSPDSSNHDDMIQMWSVNTEIISRDIEIIDNVFIAGDGPASQTILIQNEKGVGNPDLAYENITISGNVIHNGHSLGIRVSDARYVTVEENTLLWDEDAIMSGRSNAPEISFVNVEYGTVLNNISAGVPPGTEADNRIIDYNDVTSPDYFANHFVNASGVGEVDLRDLALLPDSTWSGSGAPLSQPGAVDANLAVMMARQSPEDIWTWSFDAGLSTVQGSDLAYVWTFPDGSTLEGETVTHSFSGAGTKTVALKVLDGGKTVAVLDRSFEIEGRDFVEFDFVETGLDELVGDGALVKGMEAEHLNANGYRIGGSESIYIDRDTETIHNLTNFGLEIELDPVHANSSGTFLHFHKVMDAQIAEDGSVRFALQTDEGTFEVNSGAGVFSDGSKHLIGVVYDDHAGELSLLVDGEVVSSTEASGITAPRDSWGLTIGNTWHSALEADVGSFYFGYDLDGGDSIVPGEDPVIVDDPSADETPPVEEDPVVAEGPVAEEDPIIVEEDPIIVRGPVVIEDPSVEEDPILVEDPASEKDPVAGEDPSAGEQSGPEPDGAAGPIVFSDASILLDFDEQKMEGTDAIMTHVHRGHLEFSEENAAGFRIGEGESLTIPRSIEDLHQLEGFRLEIEMALAEAGAKGTFLHLHKVMEARVMEDGTVNFWLKTDEGRFEFDSVQPVFDDLETHSFGLVYDGEGGMLEMYADGELVGSTEATGTTAPREWHGLTVGHAWADGLDAWIDSVEFEPGAGAGEEPDEVPSETYFDALLDTMVEQEEMTVEEDLARAGSDEEEALIL